MKEEYFTQRRSEATKDRKLKNSRCAVAPLREIVFRFKMYRNKARQGVV